MLECARRAAVSFYYFFLRLLISLVNRKNALHFFFRAAAVCRMFAGKAKIETGPTQHVTIYYGRLLPLDAFVTQTI